MVFSAGQTDESDYSSTDMSEQDARIHEEVGKFGVLESAIFLACKA